MPPPFLMPAKGDTMEANSQTATPDLRALLKDRRTKDAKTNRVRIPLTLDPGLQDEWEDVKSQLENARAPFNVERAALAKAAEGSMGTPDDSDIDAREKHAVSQLESRLADIERRGRAVTVDVVFQACEPAVYQELLDQFSPDEDQAHMARFTNELAARCFVGCEQSGQPIEVGTFAEIADSMQFGELDAVRSMVFAVNRRVVQTPFSSRPSTATS